MSDLLKEAIADAKAVRETAIENAKMALEEAFTPKLQSMLSAKIEEELEDEADLPAAISPGEVDEQSDSSDIGTGDNKVDVADGSDQEDPGKGKLSEDEDAEDLEESEHGMEGEETVLDDLKEEDEEEVYEDEDSEYVEEQESEEDLELESIIKELEDELEEDEHEEELEVDTEVPVEEPPVANVGVEEDEEEVDLEEILKSLREEEDELEESEDGYEGETEVVDTLKEQLEEAYGTIRSLKGTINEVNLLNAKLLFSNKIFRNHTLSESEKVRVIENFDRARSLREIKLIYSTLAESFKISPKLKKKITEGFASKSVSTTKASKRKVIAEGNELTNRMKKLAGLI